MNELLGQYDQAVRFIVSLYSILTVTHIIEREKGIARSTSILSMNPTMPSFFRQLNFVGKVTHTPNAGSPFTTSKT
jgi:hypothetical protein